MSFLYIMLAFVLGYFACWWAIKHFARIGFSRASALPKLMATMPQESLVRLSMAVETELAKRRKS